MEDHLRRDPALRRPGAVLPHCQRPHRQASSIRPPRTNTAIGGTGKGGYPKDPEAWSPRPNTCPAPWWPEMAEMGQYFFGRARCRTQSLAPGRLKATENAPGAAVKAQTVRVCRALTSNLFAAHLWKQLRSALTMIGDGIAAKVEETENGGRVASAFRPRRRLAEDRLSRRARRFRLAVSRNSSVSCVADVMARGAPACGRKRPRAPGGSQELILVHAGKRRSGTALLFRSAAGPRWQTKGSSSRSDARVLGGRLGPGCPLARHRPRRYCSGPRRE